MKKPIVLFFAAILTLGTTTGFAKKFEIAPFIGYRFGDNLNQYQYTGTGLGHGTSYGLTFDLDLKPDLQLEFQWSHQESGLSISDGAGLDRSFSLGLDYFQVGGVRHFDTGKSRPFLVGTLGMTLANPDGGGYGSNLYFSIGAGGGVKYFPSDHFGFRLEGRLYTTLIGNSGGGFCGPSGCIVGFNGAAFWQAEISVGIIFAGGK